MINRGVSKTSQYFFNSKTGTLEKNDDNIQTIESLSAQANSQIKNTEDIAKTINKNTEEHPINNITVITSQDNLIHNYFTSMDVSWDASNCLSTAIIKMPKMNTKNTNYWTTYTGQVTIYAGYNFTFDYVNQNSHQTEQDASNSLSKYWDNSDIMPFFKGEVSRVKEFDNDITIYVDSIGKRFQQTIPDEFRQSYINNQNVRDAFQAICEFLGVFYICPPKTIEDNSQEITQDTNINTDGTENNIDIQQNRENQIKNFVKNKVESSDNNTNQDNTNTTNNNEQNNNEQNNIEDDNLTNNEEIEAPQNGYKDINFDANGAIVHGQKIIETSPDMAQTLLAMEENPLEQYLEDESGVVESVQKFLNGEMFDEIHNNVMDYGAITIEPKSTSSTSMSSVGGSGATGANTGENQENSNSNGSSNGDISNFGNTSSRAREKNGWINGQYYIDGKIYLSDAYINSLSPSEAWAKYVNGQGIYRDATLNRLRARGYWQPIK